MRVSLLYSGGKDSSLCALLLEPFFEVELVTCTFGLTEAWRTAQRAAIMLGFAHRVVTLPRDILDECVSMLLDDGFPHNAIKFVHFKAVEHLIKNGAKLVADGTRLNDRVPKLTYAELQSLEYKYGSCIIRPLMGYSKPSVMALVRRYFEIEENESDMIDKADYETEIRHVIRERYGTEKVRELFPHHTQSRVILRKR